MQQLTGNIIPLAALKKIPPSLSLNHIFNKEAIKSLIHEEELQLEDGNPNMAAWNEFWRKWSPRLDMFTLGVSVTFLVGVFAAARYSRLSPLKSMALMNGFAKTFYDYLKFKKERRVRGKIHESCHSLCLYWNQRYQAHATSKEYESVFIIIWSCIIV